MLEKGFSQGKYNIYRISSDEDFLDLYNRAYFHLYFFIPSASSGQAIKVAKTPDYEFYTGLSLFPLKTREFFLMLYSLNLFSLQFKGRIYLEALK